MGVQVDPMSRLAFAICAFALLAWMPAPGTAQVDPPGVLGWEMGIVYAEGMEDTPFTLDEDRTEVRFWVRNDNLVGDISLSMEYDTSVSGTLDGEENVDVASGRNETFTIRLTDVDVWNIAALTTFTLDVQATIDTFAGAPVLLPSSQSDEAELIVPPLHRWMVNLEEIEHPISAGTEFNVGITLLNNGNTADSIRSLDIVDDCPVMTSDTTTLDQVVGVSTAAGVALASVVVYDASSTHPSRICEIELTVRSDGVAEGGDGDVSNEDSIDVQVEARPVGSDQDNDEASVGDDDGPQNQQEVTSDNFLTLPGALAPLGLLLAALARAREM
jgi:hypothetical protein